MQQFWQTLVKEFTRTFITDNRWMVFWNGFKNTILITVVAALIGIAIGIVVSVVHYLADSILHKKKRRSVADYVVLILDKLLTFYVSVMRGTPLAIQLTIMAFIIMAGFPNKVVVCCVAFGVNSGAYVSEVIRGGINSVDVGQMEAGRSLGFGYVATMRHIILPQAFKAVLPTLANEFIVLLKETAVAGYVSVSDLTYAGNIVGGNAYDYLFPLLLTAIIYLAMVMFFTMLVGKLERRLRNSER